MTNLPQFFPSSDFSLSLLPTRCSNIALSSYLGRLRAPHEPNSPLRVPDFGNLTGPPLPSRSHTVSARRHERSEAPSRSLENVGTATAEQPDAPADAAPAPIMGPTGVDQILGAGEEHREENSKSPSPEPRDMRFPTARSPSPGQNGRDAQRRSASPLRNRSSGGGDGPAADDAPEIYRDVENNRDRRDGRPPRRSPPPRRRYESPGRTAQADRHRYDRDRSPRGRRHSPDPRREPRRRDRSGRLSPRRPDGISPPRRGRDYLPRGRGGRSPPR